MFLTPLRAEAIRPKYWRVLEPLVWKTETEHYVVPAGFETDLASVPGPLRIFFSVTGASRRSAVLHDFLYRSQEITRSQADEIFRRALTYDEVNPLGRILYWSGVRIGGWVAWRHWQGQAMR